MFMKQNQQYLVTNCTWRIRKRRQTRKAICKALFLSGTGQKEERINNRFDDDDDDDDVTNIS